MISNRIDNLKYKSLFQRSFKHLLTLPGYFTFSLFHCLFMICLKSLMLKEALPVICILYFEFLLYNVLNSIKRFKYWQTFFKGRLLFPKNYVCRSYRISDSL